MLGLFSSATLLPGCSRDKHGELISTLVPPDEGVIPGEARYVPSTCTECPAHCGLLVRLRENRPVKLEGLPEHPVSRGGLCLRGQASLARLYHPERIREPLQKDGQGRWQPLSWGDAYSRIVREVQERKGAGRSAAWLSGRTTGTLDELLEAFAAGTGIERSAEYELYSHAALRQAAGMLFGVADLPVWKPEKADLLVTFGADLAETFVQPVAYTKGLSDVRLKEEFAWWHLEPHFSLTGANADRRLRLNPGSEAAVLLYLFNDLAQRSEFQDRVPAGLKDALPSFSAAEAARRSGVSQQSLEDLAQRLAGAGAPLVIAGSVGLGHSEALEAALLALLLQNLLDPAGERADWRRTENYAGLADLNTMQELTRRLRGEEIGVLFVSRCNPVYNLPLSFAFSAALEKVPLVVGLGEIMDETLEACDLILPLSNGLESWGDAVPRSGVRSALRPVIAQLHDTRTEGDILLDLWRALEVGAVPAESWQKYLLQNWDRLYPEEQISELAVQGFVLSRPQRPAAQLRVEDAARTLESGLQAPVVRGAALVVAPSLRTFDGRSRPLPHTAEIPDPLTTISYGAWVSLAAEALAGLGAEKRDLLELSAGSWRIILPAKAQPGLSGDVLALQRDSLDGLPLEVEARTGELIMTVPSLGLRGVEGSAALPVLAGSASQHGRGLIPDPVHLKEKDKKEKRYSLYPEHVHEGYRWGMVIDLELCTGCSGCVAACYIENNVPVVGKKDHLKGREMSWLRIEPFYEEDGRVGLLPMLCQHCHFAPCEPVCPVYAAYHNPEGLNVQVYQRCVGTRYCSNNCPYKVRRFNFWQPRRPEPLDLMLNPDLVARDKGMMEKCTFCIQRIRNARDQARDEERPIRDGEFTTACAQSCPANAITFGDLNDETSRVAKLAGDPRAYTVFEKLGTVPSIHYLAPRKTEGTHG